jgi:hypothetical protein
MTRTPKLRSQRGRTQHLRHAVTVVVATLTLVGCSNSPDATTPEDLTALQHVHGIVGNPGGDGILIATHAGIYGLASVDGNSELTKLVGGWEFDAMGITSTADTLYASGHPGPTTPEGFGSPNVGLVQSDDGALTWRSVSLAGVADFHDLSAVSEESKTIYGLQGEALRRSDDGGQTWVDLPTVQARDIVVSPGSGGTLYATTEAGLAVSSDRGESFATDPRAPVMYVIAARNEGGLVGVDLAGTVRYQDGPSAEWVSGGTLSGTAQAFSYLDEFGVLLVADDRGVLASEDFGVSWVTLIAS